MVAVSANPNAPKPSLNQQQLQQLQIAQQGGQVHPHMPQHPGIGIMPDDNEIISKRKLHELVAQLSPNEKLDTEVWSVDVLVANS